MKKLFISAIISAFMGLPAHSAEWPTRSVTLIVGYAPGGSTDIVARVLAASLSKKLGVAFVVENKSGANGDIAASELVNSTPDGYNLMVTTDSITASPAIRKTRYDPIKDFTPIAMLATGPFLLAANPSVKANSVSELISLARNDPEKYSYATSGVGNSQHFAGEKFNAMTGLTLVHVPYRGGGAAITDLLSNQVPLGFLGTGPLMQYVQTHKIKPLAVTSIKRSPLLPNVPTLDESGLSGYDMSTWIGLIGPAGLPDQMVEKLNKEITQALQEPDIKKQINNAGMEPTSYSAAEFTDRLKDSFLKFKELAESQRMTD
ncbi:Bug family tripartite tricarboxylate transporter substrate binding protein [Candidimonas nitroreducens]|uniref:Bug family tripartite tricarboxylate transporter substrate binding protein n=1 Tax=Candidimonas nitroreducens TaxID=683354 RepID=UPI001303CD6C|nr:tripartite tricarboxylate transporter substrate binding protein [Candidimonas nitroreducens]